MRGRPKKEITRDVVFKVRLNANEHQMLTQASEWVGLAKSEVLRKALFNYCLELTKEDYYGRKNKP